MASEEQNGNIKDVDIWRVKHVHLCAFHFWTKRMTYDELAEIRTGISDRMVDSWRIRKDCCLPISQSV